MGGQGGEVMGIEEGTFWDEHWVLYGNQFDNKLHILKKKEEVAVELREKKCTPFPHIQGGHWRQGCRGRFHVKVTHKLCLEEFSERRKNFWQRVQLE